MAITSLTTSRYRMLTVAQATSDLTAPVYYYWYLDGRYVGQTRDGRWNVAGTADEQMRLDVVDSVDPDEDPIAIAPAGYPARRTVEFIRSTDADVDYYLVRAHKVVTVTESTPEDGHQLIITTPPGIWQTTGNTVLIGRTSGFEAAGSWRFPTLAVPQGATILPCDLALTTTTGAGTPSVRLQGEDTDDAAAYGAPSRYPLSVTPTAASLDIAPVITAGARRKYDIREIIAEIIARPGWVSNNNIAILAFDLVGSGTHNIEWEAIEAAGTSQAQLTIRYASETLIVARIAEDGRKWSRRATSVPLDDLSQYMIEVVPVDAAGNEGTPQFAPAIKMVHTPDAPNFSAAFDEGTTKVTFASA